MLWGGKYMIQHLSQPKCAVYFLGSDTYYCSFLFKGRSPQLMASFQFNHTFAAWVCHASCLEK